MKLLCSSGVLRGEKTRFQLFGDTVNTAARMESTGEPGKIQASESTAKLILNAGKLSWVQAREETVHAKGKITEFNCVPVLTAFFSRSRER